MKKMIFLLLLIVSASVNAYAADLSDWAVESYNNISTYGFLNKDVVEENMKDNITREEFCSLLMNIYKCSNRVILQDKDKAVFTDTDNLSVLEAYKVGIVSGKGERIFEPQSSITRQEMAVMLSRMLNLVSIDYNKFEGQIAEYKSSFIDYSQTADWAISDMAAMSNYKIITGNELKQAQPLNNATREQAICMLDRVYKNFITNSTTHTLPVFKSLDKELALNGKIKATWQSVPEAKEYYVIIKIPDANSIVYTVPAKTTSIDEAFTSAATYDSCTIILGVLKNYGTQIFSKSVNINAKLSEKSEENNVTSVSVQEEKIEKPKETIEEINQPQLTIEAPTQITYDEALIHSTEKSALSEKEKRIFNGTIYYQTEEIAKMNIVEVEVPVWRLQSDGTKTSGVAYIEVHKALADDVVSIFTEIYNDPSQFPIKDVGGYYWRNTAFGRISQHSYGTCIDINYKENYFVQTDGTPITGTHWLPGEDPYSIPENSIVVKTFAKYGWLWGGNAWGSNNARDYMHFTYLGK